MSDVAQVNYAVRYFDRSFLYRTPQSRLKMCEEISPQLAIHINDPTNVAYREGIKAFTLSHIVITTLRNDLNLKVVKKYILFAHFK